MAATLPELKRLDRAALEALVEAQQTEIEHLQLLLAKLKRASSGGVRRNWTGRSGSWSCGWRSS